MSRLSVSSATCLALVLGACAGKAHYNPFQVPPEQLRASVKVVALGPTQVPRDLSEPELVRARFDHLLENQLRAGGYTVVSYGESQVLWDSLALASKGLYDPVTGQPDESKIAGFRSAVFHELRARYGVDALLLPAILVVPAKLDGDVARWDGTSQGAARKKFWKALLGVSHSGTIPAMSLNVRLSDGDDRALYENRGGIQVLAKAGVQRLEDVPRSELFVDEERNLKAVHLALDPLLRPDIARK